MSTDTLAARAPSSNLRTVLDVLRRAIGRWGLIVALLVLPVVYGIQDLTSGYPGFAHGHGATAHDLIRPRR